MYNYLDSSPLKTFLPTAPNSFLIFVFLGWKHAFHVTWKKNILARLSKFWWFQQALHNLQKRFCGRVCLVYLFWFSSFVRSVLLVMMAMLRFLKGSFSRACVWPLETKLIHDLSPCKRILRMSGIFCNWERACNIFVLRLQHFGRLAIKTVALSNRALDSSATSRRPTT